MIDRRRTASLGNPARRGGNMGGVSARAVGTVAAAAVIVAAGCAPITRNHGYVPSADQLAELDVGADSRAEVADIVGTPSAEGMRNGETWYYVASRRQTRGLFAPEVLDRQILAISFGESGRISNIERFGLQDGQVVTLSRRVTDPAVDDLNLLRQIFGGLGTPTAEDFLE